jgi:hypothetical protein
MGEKFKYQGFTIRATGIASPNAGTAPKRSGESKPNGQQPQGEQKTAA